MTPLLHRKPQKINDSTKPTTVRDIDMNKLDSVHDFCTINVFSITLIVQPVL